jgi:outer membrane receptor protein involved in Fe transport
MKYVLILLFLFTFGFTHSLTAQNGSLTGVVLDATNGESVIGAAIVIEDTTLGTATDLDGRYIIRNIPAGVYTITISYVGYNTTRISDVEIVSGRQTTLDVLLEQGNLNLDAVTVTAFRQSNTIESVVQEVRMVSQIATGISGQQIAKSQDSDAAQVLQRVPGITIADNRFVIIRGLGERYNNVLINNVVAPSTEVDKRTFSFDLISSSSLDRMLIYKSGSADLPGDFAGGIIKLYTVDHSEEDFLKIDFGIGLRSGTTGRSFWQSETSPTDFIGFDNGFRTLPSNFPDTFTLQSSARNSQIRIDAANMLPNNFNPQRGTALTNNSLGVAMGSTFNVGKYKVASINTIDYSIGYQYFERDFFRYFEWVDRSQPILKRFAYKDQNYRQDTQLSLMSNWNIILNARNSISFKNLFNQIGENETIIRNGFDFIQRPDDDLTNYLLGFRSRSIYTGQLSGIHHTSEHVTMDWNVGGSYLKEAEPDLRRFRTFRSQTDPTGPFIMQMPPSSNLFDTGRYYGDLDEFSINQGLNFTLKPESRLSEIKTGYVVNYRYRDFASRYISYLYPGFFDPQVREELIRLPLDQIFAPENIRTQDGFVLEEGTRPIDNYTASSLTAAGYLSSVLSFNQLQLSTGLRVEYNVQQMNSQDDFEEIIVETPVTSFLPFLNTTYELTQRSQIRFGYSRTVNRPEFREMAPFVFYDYKLDAGRAGNPNLKPATIDNLDLRFEFYPRLGELITFGIFYKYFDDPIENKTIVTTESPQFSYINADYAYNYGAEIEFRKSLSGVTSSAIMDRFSMNFNASIIFSKVNLGETAVAQSQERALQGQSPYIINAALYYDDLKRGLSGSLVYNIIGPRIFSVGDVLFPTIYEMPRHSLDLTATMRVRSNVTIKAGIKDLLNAPFEFVQDSNRNDKADSQDDIIFSYRRGQLLNASVSFRF